MVFSEPMSFLFLLRRLSVIRVSKDSYHRRQESFGKDINVQADYHDLKIQLEKSLQNMNGFQTLDVCTRANCTQARGLHKLDGICLNKVSILRVRRNVIPPVEFLNAYIR